MYIAKSRDVICVILKINAIASTTIFAIIQVVISVSFLGHNNPVNSHKNKGINHI